MQAIIAQMTSQERAAAQAFYFELTRQFGANAAAMWQARSAGDVERYSECVQETRRLYREIQEVEFTLETGVLPF